MIPFDVNVISPVKALVVSTKIFPGPKNPTSAAFVSIKIFPVSKTSPPFVALITIFF